MISRIQPANMIHAICKQIKTPHPHPFHSSCWKLWTVCPLDTASLGVVLVQGTNEGWTAAQEWVLQNGSLNVPFLRKSFGDARVCCTDVRGYNSYANLPLIAGHQHDTSKHAQIKLGWPDPACVMDSDAIGVETDDILLCRLGWYLLCSLGWSLQYLRISLCPALCNPWQNCRHSPYGKTFCSSTLRGVM